MIVKAYAKINLTLDITRKRSNGYHELNSIMQTISLCDNVELKKHKDSKITLYCTKKNVPLDERNTAYKAAQAIMDHFDLDMGVDILIDKNIPMEAGMGGGSSDAAAVLKGMIKLYDLEISKEELKDIATAIGADVPFCLIGGTCKCSGIGDIVEPITPFPDCTILICKPPVGVKTPEAYRESDKYPQDDFIMTDSMVEALKTKNLDNVMEFVSNRFDDILHMPEVQIIKSLMNEGGALQSCMTGSGSSVYGIYTKYEEALKTADILKQYGEVFVTNPISSENI